jgi:hypothetical protein
MWMSPASVRRLCLASDYGLDLLCGARTFGRPGKPLITGPDPRVVPLRAGDVRDPPATQAVLRLRRRARGDSGRAVTSTIRARMTETMSSMFPFGI